MTLTHKPIYRCDHCGQEFVSKGGRDGHIRERRCPVLRDMDKKAEENPPVSPENPRWERKMVLSGGMNIFSRTTDA